MRKTTSTFVVAIAALALWREAVANNPWSSAYRDGTVALPSAEESASNRGTGVAINHGRAGYAVPIEVPPGFAGLVPELSLQYTSSRVEGALGAQWGLGGVPTLAVRTSGRGGQPFYGTGVTYVGFSGEELVSIPGAGDIDGDGVADATYREERDRLFVRYIERSTGGWEAHYPDGRKLRLGTTAAARVARTEAAYTNQIWMWLPEILVDPQGNELVYTWADAGTALGDPTMTGGTARYLVEIRYGCRGCAAAASYQRVAFTYAARSAAGLGNALDLRAGFLVEWKAYLTEVATFTHAGSSGDLPIRRYALRYGADTRRLLLAAVDTVGDDGTSMPTLSFTYTDEGAPASPTSTVTSVPLKNGVPLGLTDDVFISDMDGDGRLDLVKCEPVAIGTYRWWRNIGTDTLAFDPAGTNYSSPPAVCPGAGDEVSVEDGDRNLRPDLHDFRSVGGGVAIYEFADAATGWTAVGNAIVSTAGAGDDLVRSDRNRDGYVDLMTTGASSWTISVDDSTYDYTVDEVTCDGTGGVGISPTYGVSVLGGSDAGLVLGDVTGDDVSETLFADITSTSAASATVYVWPGRGRSCFGFVAEDGRGATPHYTTTITAAADGLSKILPNPSEIQASDVNGDGFDDLVWIDQAGGRVGVWTFDPATGFTPAFLGSQTITAAQGCQVGDFDGDAAAEVLCSDDWTLYDFADEQPHLLATVNNGRGVTASISYTSSALMAAEAEAAGHPWATNVAAPVRFANLLVIEDGRDGREIRSFVARDAYYKEDEAADIFEVVGFAYIEETRTAEVYTGTAWVPDARDPGRTTRSWYDVGATQWPLRGATLCQETWAAGAAPASYTCGGAVGALSRNQLTYILETDADGVTITVATASDRFVLEGNASGQRIRTEHRYDDYGNELTRVEWGLYRPLDIALGDDEAMTATDWITDTSTWMLRRPKRVTSGGVAGSAAAPTVTAQAVSFFYYDGNTAWDVTGVTGGLRTETRRWACDPTVAGDPRCAAPGDDANAVTAEAVQYTTAGLVAAVTDAVGVVTASAYDPDFGLFLTSKTLDPGGLDLTTSFVVDPRHGGPTRMTGPDGQVTLASYDSLGRMTVLARPGDSLAKPTVSRSFHDGAPISRVVDVAKDGTANGLNRMTYLDGHGRVLCNVREAGGDLIHVEEQKEWSALGNLGVSAVPYTMAPRRGVFPCKPHQVVTSQSVGARTIVTPRDEQTVDPLGRPLNLVHSADGSRRSWNHGVLRVTERDEEDNASGVHAGTPRVQIFDGRGRVVRVTETHLFSDVDPGTHSFAYSYTFDGQLESVVNSEGTTINTSTHDSRRRLVRTVDATRGTTAFTYDDVGRISSSTDARGETLSYLYDDAGRVESVTDSSGTTDYQYDAHPDPTRTASCNTAGRLSHVDYPAGQTTYCYDQAGRTRSETVVVHSLGTTAYLTEYTWDALDRIGTIRYPDTTRALYNYGADGWLEGIRARSASGVLQGIVTDVAYTAWGAPATVSLGNGALLSYEHDGRGRPRRSIVQSGGVELQNLLLGLDRVGNVAAIQDQVGFASATYTYDDLYRLVSATGDRYGGETATYQYDRLGNITARNFTDTTSPLHVGAFTYAHATNPTALTAAAGRSYTYDEMGNLIGDGSLSFGYTPAGSLSTVSDLAGIELVEMEYNQNGRRIAKLSATGEDVYYFAESELRDDGTPSWEKHLFVGGRLVARFEDTFTAADVADHVFFIATDHLGSPTLVLNTAGAVVERYDHHPFGEESLYSLEAADAASGTTDFTDAYFPPGDPGSKLDRRFQGQEVDSELGSYNFTARLYLPGLSRFFTADSLVPRPLDSQSWNRYAFVRNNPLAFIDPSGHADRPVTATDENTQFWVDDLLEDVGGEVPHGYTIEGLDPLRQFAMNYRNDGRDPGNTFHQRPEGYVVNQETNFNMTSEIDAILKANTGIAGKQAVDGYHFVYSFTNAEGELVTKSLTLDPRKWTYSNSATAEAGVGGTFELAEVGISGGASVTAGTSQTTSGAHKNVEGLYTSRFVTLRRSGGTTAYEIREYAPDPVDPMTKHSESTRSGVTYDPGIPAGWCPGNCHLPQEEVSTTGSTDTYGWLRW